MFSKWKFYAAMAHVNLLISIKVSSNFGSMLSKLKTQKLYSTGLRVLATIRTYFPFEADVSYLLSIAKVR
jgi:hypothetical protein